MPQTQQTKGGGKGDGENPKRPSAASEQQPQDLSTAGPLASYIQQDLEHGLGDDPMSFLNQHGDEEAPDGDDREAGMPHDSVQAQGPQSPQVTEDHNNGNPTFDQRIFDAVDKGAAGKLDKLLSRGGVSPDCRDNQGRTPLIVVAEAGNAALVGVLFRHGADVNAVDVDGETPFMKAAYRGDLELVELLISKQAALDMRNNEGLSALEIAQEMGHEAVVAFLSAQTAGSTGRMAADTSTDPDDNGPTTDGPAGASLPVPAVMMPSPAPPSYVPDLDLESNPELEKPLNFKPQTEPEIAGEDREQGVLLPSQDDGSEFAAESPSAGEQAHEALSAIRSRHDTEKRADTRPAPTHSVLAANEERIEFDALDNKQVRSINEKVIRVLDKAGLEVGDYVVDTVFKGSHMAVLKRRSQENKRWRKLKKHPEWVMDPLKLTQLAGACAARRYCLAEGIDISPLSLSHFIELYYVKDLKLLLTLAEDAITNNYTVRQLKQAVDDLREHKDDHDPGKVIIKTLDQPVPLLDDPDLAELCKDKDRVLEELSRAERKKIRSLIKARKPGLDEWKDLMDTFEEILSDLEDE